jgi:hypothetical protein
MAVKILFYSTVTDFVKKNNRKESLVCYFASSAASLSRRAGSTDWSTALKLEIPEGG